MRAIFTAILLFLFSNTVLSWEIHSGGVDDLILGKKLPPSFVQKEKLKINKLICDAVPFKGFIFKDPPLEVSLEHKKVSKIRVNSEALKTKENIGVGSTFKQIKTVYNDANLRAVPPCSGNDEAAASTSSLPNVYFYFKDLKNAKAGSKVTRISIFQQ